jgi:protein-S-isoprenylcysteine O-methyltransferase Ste14
MFWLIFSVAVWGVVHSWMASLKFKETLRRILGSSGVKFYRLFYNVFSVISIAPVFYLMLALPDKDFYQVPNPWSYLMFAGSGISVLLLFVAVLQTDVLSFVGVRQLFQEEQPAKLVTRGFYRVVRHPLYTFGLLALWLSSSVSLNTFIVYLGLTIYILVGIYFEERKLLREFGQAYADYQSVTPMLVPGLKFGGNK